MIYISADFPIDAGDKDYYDMELSNINKYLQIGNLTYISEFNKTLQFSCGVKT